MRLPPLFFSVSVATMALAGCGAKDSADAVEVVQVVPAPPAVTEIVADKDATPPLIAATDVLGQFDGTISGIALWRHPTLPSQSAVIVANGVAGLFVIPMDRSAPTRIDGDFSGAIGISADGDVALIAAYEATTDSIRLFSIDPASRELSDVASFAVSGGAKALCFAPDEVVRVAADGNVFRHRIMVGDGGTITLPATQIPAMTGVDCASADETVYILSVGDRVPGLRIARIDGETLAFEGTPPPSSTVSIAAFSGPSGNGDQLVYAIENGAVMVGGAPFLFADDAGALAIGRLSAGNGNFGGAYRGGALAMVSTENHLATVTWQSVQLATGLTQIATDDASNVEAMPRPDLSDTVTDEARERLNALRIPPTTPSDGAE